MIAWLRHVCLPDPVYPEAIVYSLYYDTPALDSYHEKVDGDFIKTKCRLRWYDPDLSADPALRTAYLEIKHKIGQGRRKTRVRVDGGARLARQRRPRRPRFSRRSSPATRRPCRSGCRRG